MLSHSPGPTVSPSQCGERVFEHEAFSRSLLVGNIVCHENSAIHMTTNATDPVWLGITNVAVLAGGCGDYVARIEMGEAFVDKTPKTFTLARTGMCSTIGRGNYT